MPNDNEPRQPKNLKSLMRFCAENSSDDAAKPPELDEDVSFIIKLKKTLIIIKDKK